MIIPKRFNILNHTFKVKIVDQIVNDNESRLGECCKDLCSIDVATHINDDQLPDSVMEHTFFHEVTHVILDMMGEEKLSSDEKFVDVFSGLLHQVIKTSKY
jgi:hypothetical protein